ncbi:MAG: hypothetical protein ACO1SV_23790 [Fimbriimonas sp.]
MAAFAVANQDGLLIRRALQEGASDTYKVETVTQQTVNLPNGMGEQEMGTTVVATYQMKTGKVDAAKKSAAVELVYTIDKMEADGTLGAMMGGGGGETGKPTTLAGTLDELGRVKMELPKEGNAAAAAMISGAQAVGTSTISVELPEKAVKVGDTWEIVIPKSPFTGSADQKLTAKLVGEKEVDGKLAYVISTAGNFKTDADLTKMAEDAPGPMKGQKMLMKGTIDLKSDGVVEKATGRTLRITTKMKMKQTLELPDMGFTIDTNGTTSTLVTLK